MALQLYIAAAPRTSLVQTSEWPGIISKQRTIISVACDYTQMIKRDDKGRKSKVGFRVKSSLDAVEAVAEVGRVTEVNKDTFWPIVEAAGDKTVVLDMFTQWCGPCKLIAPKYQALSEKYDDVVFLKLDCNQENKPLAKELEIKVVPTFKILKGSKVVKEVRGAKFDDLVAAIENVRCS